MHGRRGFLLLLLVSVAAVGSMAAAPASQPAAEAQGAADHSSPEKTWATLCAAVNRGDVNAFRACFSNRNEISTLFLEAFSDLTVTTFQLANATADLGEEGKAISARLATTYTDVVKNGEGRKTEISGEEASWTKTVHTATGDGENSIYFRHVHGEWLIDTAESYNLNSAAGRKAAEDMMEATGPQVKKFKEIIEAIKTKKITTVDQMRAKLEEK